MKTATTIEEQIGLLRSHGITINDEEKAKEILPDTLEWARLTSSRATLMPYIHCATSVLMGLHCLTCNSLMVSVEKALSLDLKVATIRN